MARPALCCRWLAPSSSRTLFSGRLWLWPQVPCSLMHAKPCMLQVLLGHLIQWPNTTLCSSGSVLQAFGGPLPNRKCTCIHERQVLSWPAFSGCSARLLGCCGLHSLVVRLGWRAAVVCIVRLVGLPGGPLWPAFSGSSAWLVGCSGLHSLVDLLGWWAAVACILRLVGLAAGLL